MPAVLEIRNLRKAFGGVVALSGVDVTAGTDGILGI
ncbi:MAG: ABC transporter ATP-binding protein, partial [Methylobacteriaceae bacterium]|nr:ABC transporter ATP-binding protein [Methylobacteriaceae bacterium]